MHKDLISEAKSWFEQAIPEPTYEQRCIQVGCHFEEVSEMAKAIGDFDLEFEISIAANEYKKEVGFIPDQCINRIELADSLADQIVTAVGTAYMYGIDIIGALAEVNRSNFSKFEDGKPVFDENGKITKGLNYKKPDLTKFI
ncbi:MAG: nucleoside triphosphate pyrophosphohydrolase family protein [Gammaproteobacteria bacterium]|nr:nucleoside triphosphate pyrophosphohydrolase family protein [Gammaproteobacteria bacterium]